MNHLIQKQMLDIQLPSKEGAFEQQEAIRNFYWDRIVPAMDKAFTNLAPEDTIVRLEQLTLNIEIQSIHQLENEIIRQITAQLDDTIIKIKFDQQQKIKNKKKKVLAKLSTTQQSNPEALFYFLKNGIFPWWVAKIQSPTAIPLWEKIATEQPEKIIKFLQSNISAQVRKRITKQYTFKQLMQPVSKVHPILCKRIFRIRKELLLVNILEKPSFSAWEGIVDVAIKKSILALLETVDPAQITTKKVMDTIIAQLALNLKKPENEIRKLFDKKLPQQDQKSARVLKNYFKTFPEKEKPDLKRKAVSTNNTVQKERSIINSFQSSQKPVLNQEITQSMEEGIYIDNAGLVIIAPFLSPFFKQLGFIKNQQFLSEKEQERALLLMQYLVTGEAELPENELLLNKILTGWPLEEPVTNLLELNEKEKTESRSLLQAVIEHWGALGNSKVEALRETFLQREGKLMDKDDQYKLIVERKTVDILMDRIPWSFTMIKLPWMEKRLYIEW